MAVDKKQFALGFAKKAFVRLFIAAAWCWFAAKHSHWSIGLTLWWIALAAELVNFRLSTHSLQLDEIINLSCAMAKLLAKVSGIDVEEVESSVRYSPGSEPPCEMGTEHPFDPAHKNCPGCKR